MLPGGCTAGEWTEAEPGQDGGPEGGWPHHQWFGKLPLILGEVTLTAKTEVWSLGIHLDPALPMETQVASVVCSAYFHLWRNAQLRPYLDVEALTTLAHVLVILRLDYCSAFYVGLALRLKLQMMQNAVARLLTGVRKYQHISPTMAALH